MRPMLQSAQSFRLFTAWLADQADRDDAVGAFARGFLRDTCAETLRTASSLDSHLIDAHAADAEILDARRQAWEEFVVHSRPTTSGSK